MDCRPVSPGDGAGLLAESPTGFCGGLGCGVSPRRWGGATRGKPYGLFGGWERSHFRIAQHIFPLAIYGEGVADRPGERSPCCPTGFLEWGECADFGNVMQGVLV